MEFLKLGRVNRSGWGGVSCGKDTRCSRDECVYYYKKMLCMVCIVEINAPVVEKSRLCKGTRERGVVT